MNKHAREVRKICGEIERVGNKRGTPYYAVSGHSKDLSNPEQTFLFQQQNEMLNHGEKKPVKKVT